MGICVVLLSLLSINITCVMLMEKCLMSDCSSARAKMQGVFIYIVGRNPHRSPPRPVQINITTCIANAFSVFC